MSLQIIILHTNSQADGSFSVSGVFWLTPPSNNIVPKPDFISAVPFIDSTNLFNLQYGNIVEQTFNSGLFPYGTSLAEVQSALQDQFNAAQQTLSNTNSPLSGLIGATFDGSSWSSSNPFIPVLNEEFPTSYCKRYFNWTNLKSFFSNKKGALQYSENNIIYTIYFYDEHEVYACNIWKGTLPNSVIVSGYSQNQNDEDKADFEGNYKSSANKRINAIDDQGRQLTVDNPRMGSEIIYASNNFCDPCSWFSGSVRIKDEVLTGDGYQFTSSHINWIDMVSGRVLNDDGLAAEQMIFEPSDPHGYYVIVKVDNVEKTARAPFAKSGGDYEIFYEDGYVKFFEEVIGTVTASYSYASSSVYVIQPKPGEYFDIENAEADFSIDAVMKDTIYYAVFGYVDVFAPQYMYRQATGTVTISNDIITGTGTFFTSQITPGQYVRLETDGPESYMIVASVDSDTQITLAMGYTGGSSGTLVYSNTYTGVYPSGYKIELRRSQHKRLLQVFIEAMGSYPVTGIKGVSPGEELLSDKEFRRQARGSKTGYATLPFRYATVTRLSSSMGLELRVGLMNNIPFEGEMVTFTIYGTSGIEV